MFDLTWPNHHLFGEGRSSIRGDLADHYWSTYHLATYLICSFRAFMMWIISEYVHLVMRTKRIEPVGWIFKPLNILLTEIPKDAAFTAKSNLIYKGYTIPTALWSLTCFNEWKHEQNHHAVHWNLNFSESRRLPIEFILIYSLYIVTKVLYRYCREKRVLNC